jgi:hypothetical protein
MPKVIRQVEADVSVDELNADLAGSLGQIDQGGVFLPGPDGPKGEPIQEGDFLIPSDDVRSAVNIMPETCVYVVTLVPLAGIFWGVFYQANGNKAVQFFSGQSFTGKYQVAPVEARRGRPPAKVPAKVPTKRGRKPLRR